jgi:hypothetical protein
VSSIRTDDPAVKLVLAVAKHGDIKLSSGSVDRAARLASRFPWLLEPHTSPERLPAGPVPPRFAPTDGAAPLRLRASASLCEHRASGWLNALARYLHAPSVGSHAARKGA